MAGSWFVSFYHVKNFLQFVFSKVLLFGKKGQHPWIGVIEILAHDIFHCMLLIIFPADDWKVTIHIANTVMIQETFFFQDLYHGSNTVIMWCGFRQLRDYFFNKSFTKIP